MRRKEWDTNGRNFYACHVLLCVFVDLYVHETWQCKRRSSKGDKIPFHCESFTRLSFDKLDKGCPDFSLKPSIQGSDPERDFHHKNSTQINSASWALRICIQKLCGIPVSYFCRVSGYKTSSLSSANFPRQHITFCMFSISEHSFWREFGFQKKWKFELQATNK